MYLSKNALSTLVAPNHILIWDISTSPFGNAIPVRNEEISPCNFSINPLKIVVLKENKDKKLSIRT